jgi:hypothetical protein
VDKLTIFPELISLITFYAIEKSSLSRRLFLNFTHTIPPGLPIYMLGYHDAQKDILSDDEARIFEFGTLVLRTPARANVP